MAYLGNIEYEPDEFGVAVRVKCPLVDTWIDPVDCMENQGNNEAAIPERFKTQTRLAGNLQAVSI